MKKLSGLLAAVLVFAFSATGAFAATFTDMADQPNTVKDAVAKTVALGIIEGYEDGTFGADQNLTRAEFAKIAVTASGAADTATMLEGSKPNFSDVKAGAWYTGWINASESLGIFQGDGNGKFRPNDTISNQEVITVLMRMLGYNDNLKGSWPVNYVTEANKQDITEDVSIVASAAAKRGDVVVMLDAALDTDMVTYDKDTDEFVKKQTKINESEYVTLLDDAFDGAYVEVTTFDEVDQIRDVAKQQLNWSVEDKEGDEVSFIIDDQTAVSSNGGNLFDLKGHQGKVYYVKDGDKAYARFIEVESYVKAVSDPATMSGSKIDVNGTKYNSVGNGKVLFTANAGGSGKVAASVGDLDFYYGTEGKAEKNSKYLLYFNDDDQVYAVISDKDRDDAAYFVKSISTSTLKLTGSKGSETMDNDDDEVLIWNGEEFIAPSTLEVGDAVIQIADDLYEVANAQTGVLKSEDSNGKYNIDGTKYVKTGAVELDNEYESFDGDIGDAFGNTIQYLLNDDNTISAIVVDETTSGTTLYGVVTGGDSDSATSWGGSDLNSITIFTEEGTTVEYELDDDEFKTGDVEAVSHLGQLVEYKLNKDGEIKYMAVVSDPAEQKNDKDFGSLTGEISVKNNAYLTANGKNLTMASNVVAFEITEDDGDVDVALVTRAALLASDDFTPGAIGDQDNKVYGFDALIDTDTKSANYNPYGVMDAYCAYVTNSNGAVKAIAYTDADTTTYYSGIIDEWAKDGDGDITVTFVGNETAYEFATSADEKAANDDDLIVYTLSGGDIAVAKTYADKEDLKSVELTGWSGGLMTLGVDDYDPEVADQTDDGEVTDTIMTDSETVVYVQDKNGKYSEGTLDDITKNAFVVVPVVDDDGYADVVIVDEYKTKDANKISANTEENTPTTPTWGITISAETGTVVVGEATLDLSSSYTGDAPENATYEYKSENTAIATVDPVTGVVTGVAAGTVNINVVASNGEKATCVVTVTAPATQA